MAREKAERFLTTVLFTDIVGSTEAAAELGDSGWRELVQSHHRLIRMLLRRYGGREIDTAGDGFFATFDAPAAALRFALAAAAAVSELGLQIRVGIHVGEVEQIGRKVGGISVPIGARIMATAGAGEVLASSTVRDLAAGAGFRFDDRGTRELKGVPGQWHLYAASSAASAEAESVGAVAVEADHAERRAAAVRRWRSRPIWQRYPRASAAVVLGLGLVVVLAGLAVWQPWLPPALEGVAENSVGLIDGGRNVAIREMAVGSQPAAIAFGEGSLWVTNFGSDSVSQIDPSTRAVINTIPVGHGPIGVAIAQGSVWVANSAEGTLTRINAATSRPVDTINVGNGPHSLAYAAGGVWVSNTLDGTVVRVDAQTDVAGPPIPVGQLPAAMAADEHGLWIVSADSDSVSHLDPTSGAALAPPIPVGGQPAAVALSDERVVVANSRDGTLTLIDPLRDRVVGVVDVGGEPIGLAIAGDEAWLADATGAVVRVDLAGGALKRRIVTGSSTQAVEIVGNEPWFVTGASLASHRGGTLRVISDTAAWVDPVGFGWPQFNALIDMGLVGYRRVAGPAGSRLVPELAAALNPPTDGGLTYSFRLRPGVVYSDGQPVLASHFRYAVERLFQVADPDFGGVPGWYSYSGLVGADACQVADAEGNPIPVERCDLSAGIVTDDGAGTVVFHLVAPDPYFPYALGFAPQRVDGLPPNEFHNDIRPVVGPYQIASVEEQMDPDGPRVGGTVRLVRNTHFSSWAADLRAEGFVDEVMWTWGLEPEEEARMIAAGEADAMANYESIPSDMRLQLIRRYTAQFHQAPTGTTHLFFNTSKPPFDRLEVRQAINYAIDRARVAELRGGPAVAVPTCQIVPRNFIGYRPYCPYTLEPNPAGQWSAPDLDAAQALIDQAGVRGRQVVVGPFVPRLDPVADYLVALLRDELGFDVSQRRAGTFFEVLDAVHQEPGVEIGAFTETPAPLTAASLMGLFTCADSVEFVKFCDPELDALIESARALDAIDPVSAGDRWAEVDRRVTDLALWVPLVNEGVDFVSARVGNYQFHPGYGPLLDQMWVQ